MNEKLFYPVIHCISQHEGGVGHAMANTRIALENGADGVFLIGHHLHFSELCDIYEVVRKQFPDFWIGLNFLDIAYDGKWSLLSSMILRCHGVNAIWTDQMPGSGFEIPDTPQYVQVFGGVAFKYIDSEIRGDQLKRACENIAIYLDVVTTSGNRTGEPPTLEKLIEIRAYIGSDKPLAVASGVNKHNISTMRYVADRFLVATSTTKRDPDRGNHEYLVPREVRILADLMHK